MEKMIFVNLKMYLNKKEDIQNYIKALKERNIIFFPSSIHIGTFIESGFTCGIQNISSHSSGAYTGEISALSAKEMGCHYVLIGHSEVRKNISDETEKKIKIALENNLIPVLCVGEEKNENIKNHLDKQLNVLKNIKGNVIIAYEPVWAIGTGTTPTAEEIEKIIDYIKNKYPKFKILYGGGVDESNIEKLNKIKNISGFLLGISGVKISSLLKIEEVVQK